MAKRRPKKSELIGLRLDPELFEAFERAVMGSQTTAQDALRVATRAMVSAYAKTGQIPRDMEIRQAQVAASTSLPTGNDTVLADLASRYAGYLAPRLAHALTASHVDQPRAIHDLLHSLLEHLSRGLPADDLVICPRDEWRPAPFQQVAEPKTDYLAQKPMKPPEKPSPKPGSTGPVALVSDRPA